MFEFVRRHYGVLFFAADLPGFVEAGWITPEQADLITKGDSVEGRVAGDVVNQQEYAGV